MTFARILLAAAACCALACPPLPAAAAPTVEAASAPAAARTVDRGRFIVEISGQGPDVILIPGLASSRAVWDGLMPSLAGYRVHRVQIAGFASVPAGPNAKGPVVQPFVDELARYIADEGLRAPAVIGHSMGGFSGLLLAQQHPDRVGRLMIVDAAAFIQALANPEATAEGARAGAEQFRGYIDAMSDADFARGQQMTAAGMMKSEAHRPAMVAWSLATDRKVMSQAVVDVMTTDARPGLARTRTPTTVLYAWDAAMPIAPDAMDAIYARVYAGAPELRLVRIDGSYHFIMFDQPQRLADEVKTFLAGHQ